MSHAAYCPARPRRRNCPSDATAAGPQHSALPPAVRQARLNKGVSLADAARETRIRRGYLEALEAEDPAALPGKCPSRRLARVVSDNRYLHCQRSNRA